MKKLLLASVVLAGVASLFVNAYGQTSSSGTAPKKAAGANPNSDPPHKIGLIDMGRVFKEYKKFEALREDWKAELTANENKAKDMAAKVQKLAEQMKTYKTGDDKYVELEKRQTQAAAEFESYRKNSQRMLMQKEADIYKTVYLEAMEQVDRYAKHFRYTLVMRFNSEGIEGEDLQKLQLGLNRVIVYHREEDDLTDGIVNSLNTSYLKAVPKAATRENGGKN